MKKEVKNLIKLILGLAILYFLFSIVGFSNIVETFSTANIWLILLSVIPFLLALLSAVLNVHLLINGLCKKLPFLKTMKYYLLSWCAGLIMPGKIGDFSIILFLKKEDIPVGQSTAVSITDKLITIITLFIIAASGLWLFFTPMEALYAIIIFLVLIVLIIFGILNHHTRKIIKKIIGKRSEMFRGFSKSIISYIKTKKRFLVLNLIVTLTQWVLSAITLSIIFKSFGTDIPIIIVFLISSITTLFSLVPITASGLGIKESVAVFLYSKLEYTASVVVGVHLVSLITKYLIAFIAYGYYSSKK